MLAVGSPLSSLIRMVAAVALYGTVSFPIFMLCSVTEDSSFGSELAAGFASELFASGCAPWARAVWPHNSSTAIKDTNAAGPVNFLILNLPLAGWLSGLKQNSAGILCDGRDE